MAMVMMRTMFINFDTFLGASRKNNLINRSGDGRGLISTKFDAKFIGNPTKYANFQNTARKMQEKVILLKNNSAKLLFAKVE